MNTAVEVVERLQNGSRQTGLKDKTPILDSKETRCKGIPI